MEMKQFKILKCVDCGDDNSPIIETRYSGELCYSCYHVRIVKKTEELK